MAIMIYFTFSNSYEIKFGITEIIDPVFKIDPLKDLNMAHLMDFNQDDRINLQWYPQKIFSGGSKYEKLNG